MGDPNEKKTQSNAQRKAMHASIAFRQEMMEDELAELEEMEDDFEITKSYDEYESEDWDSCDDSDAFF